jgi:uncharacterized protein YndB with AHSA1/START domain
MTDEVVVECDLDEPPEKVWRALTTPELVDAWLAPAEVGADYEMVESDPGKRVSWRWTEGEPPRESTVTFVVGRTAEGGSHLRLVHSAPAKAATRMQLERLRWAA